MEQMIENNSTPRVNRQELGNSEQKREAASEHAREVYESLPAEKKEIILGKLNEHRSTAWAHSIATRKGKALSEEHKAKLGASKRGRAWKGAKVSLWAKAEDALLGLSTTESAKNRGVRQGAVYQSRIKMGFPPGWPGAYRHGEVLTRMHVEEFCEDVGLTHEEAAEFIGLGYGAFRNLVGKTSNRPLSSRHPRDRKSPHIGRMLKEKCEQVVSRFCYEQGKRWLMRNFLRSEVRGLTEKHSTLTLAFTALGVALRSGKTGPETAAVMQWICERAMQEFASGQAGKASEKVFRTLLFLGLPLRDLLDAQPELLRTEGDPQSGFRPSRLASELLAQDYGATPGRIDAVIKGEALPLDPRLLCLLEKCGVCKVSKDEHKTDGHLFEQDKNLPVWRGWHAFRRGLATNLHALGIADKEIQAILRHSNIAVTQSCYIKALTESQVSAMDLVGEEFENSSIN